MKKIISTFSVVLIFLLSAMSVYAQDYDLEGVIKLTDLQQEPFSKWFNENYAAAHPNDAVLSKIKPLLKDKKMTIVMGTWCSDSRMWVPYFFRMLDLMNYDDEDVKIIALDRDKTADGVDMSKYKIERIPTFIIYDKSGKELGRIVESPRYSLEKDLLEILNKDAKE